MMHNTVQTSRHLLLKNAACSMHRDIFGSRMLHAACCIHSRKCKQSTAVQFILQCPHRHLPPPPSRQLRRPALFHLFHRASVTTNNDLHRPDFPQPITAFKSITDESPPLPPIIHLQLFNQNTVTFIRPPSHVIPFTLHITADSPRLPLEG